MAAPQTRSKRLARAICLATLALIALPGGSALAAPAGPPQLNLNPGANDFGTVEIDRGDGYTNFNVYNAGDDWVTLSTRIDGPDAGAFWISGDGCGGGSLAPQWSCNVGVQFRPSEGRDYHATFVVNADGVDFTAELTGTGGLRQVTPSPSVVEFGEVALGEGSTRSLTLRNSGNVFFQSIVAIPVGGAVGAFRVLEDGCSLVVLAPNVSCAMKLRFAPYEAGRAEAALAIIGDGNPTLVALRGDGVAASPAGPVASAGPAPAPPATVNATANVVVNAPPRGAKAQPKRVRKPARIAFNWRRGMPVPYQGDRVDLGVARCVGAPTCRVSVRAWLVTSVVGEIAGTRTTSVRRSTWWVGNGSRVSLSVPRDLRGSRARLIVDLRTKAAGRPVGVQRLNIRLIEGLRRGGAVVATPRS